jgi:hypothetical protein
LMKRKGKKEGGERKNGEEGGGGAGGRRSRMSPQLYNPSSITS